MGFVVQTILSFLLMMIVECTVKVRDTVDITIYTDDIHAYNISQLFDLATSVKPVCEVKASPATIYKAEMPLVSKDISIYAFVDQPEIVEFVSNTTVYGIFDNKNILIQNITLDGERFSGLLEHNFGLLGDEAICSDLHLNDKLNRIYVLCYTDPSKQLDKFIYVAELDSTSGELLNKVQVASDPQVVQHRLQMSYVVVTENNVQVPYIFVYDQGASSGINDKNRWVLVLANAIVGNLRSLGFTVLDNTVSPLTYFYDLFHFKTGVLLTGKVARDGPISMTFCTFVSSPQPAFTCVQTPKPAAFATKVGYVGIINTGQYVEVNNDPVNPDVDYLSKCDFGGDFSSPSFIDADDCAQMHSYNISDNATISLVEGNVHQLVIKYVYFDGTYAGYSVHNFDLRIEWLHIDDSQASHLVPLGKNLVRVNKDSMEIHRMVPDFVYFKGSDLADGMNLIRIECTDQDSTTPVPNILRVYKMDDLKENVIANGTQLPTFSVYEGDEIFFGVEPRMIMGNDLQCNVDFEPQTFANLTRSKVYDTEPINIDFRFTKSSADFQEIRFVGEFAVIKDNRGWVAFFRCQFTSIASVLCTEQAAYGTAGHSVRLERDVSKVFDWVFAWSVDLTVNTTIVYVFDGVSSLYTYTFGGVAADAQMSEVGSSAYLTLAFNGDINKIDGYEFTIGNPASFEKLPTITPGLSGFQYFCPTDIDFDPEDDDILEVLSVCPGKDQRIIRYMYPPDVDAKTGRLTLRLLTSIPINFAYTSPQYCSMGTEFIIYSLLSGNPNIQSTNIYDDLNQWTFGWNHDDLNLGKARSFQCVGRAGMFTVFSLDSNQNSVLSVYFGNNQRQANHRVFNVQRNNLNDYKFVHSFEFFGQVIHVLFSPVTGYNDYMLTFSKELYVEAEFLHGIGNASVTMNLKCTNGDVQKYLESTTVSVVVPNNNTLFTATGKSNGAEAGIFQLEKFIKVTGPLLDAFVQGTDKISLIGRVKPLSIYKPDPSNFNEFTHFETVAQISVGVHVYESNSTVMSIFHGINEFVGTFTPAHGVNAFHFAILPTDNTSILIAYSTAEPTDNSLQLVVLQDNIRVAIGRSQEGQVQNFSKIRVLPCKFKGSQVFYVWAKNSDEQTLHEFKVTLNGAQIAIDATNLYSDVADFSVAAPSASQTAFVLIVRASDRTVIDIETLPISSEAVQERKRFSVNYNKHIKKQNGDLADTSFEAYRIISITAKNHNESVFYILINTESINIYEIIVDTVSLKVLAVFSYNKVPGFDGHHLDGNNRHLVHMVGSRRTDDRVRYVFYHRIIDGSDGSADPYWSLHNDQPRPFTLTNCIHNNSHFQLTTSFRTVPLYFLTVGRMTLNISEGADFSKAKIEIEGIPHATFEEFSIQDIIGGVTPEPTGSSAWWPYFVILGILIFIAVGFIAWKAKKDKKTKEDGNYESLKPDVQDP